jgi:putative DNA primase/helicase
MSSTGPLLDAALEYAAQGWPVFPLAPGTKVPAIPKAEGGRGFHDASTDPDQIRRWWKRWPQANIGLPTGTRSGVIVIDEDPRNGGDARALNLPLTRICRTPHGGRHFYYRHPGAGILVPCDTTGKLGKGIDVRGDGGYVVLPPSVLREGGDYDWLT